LKYLKSLYTQYIVKSYKNNLGKDVIISMIARVVNTILNLFLLSLSLKILSPNNYGIWLTVSALYTWVSLFDFGAQNTLRNALAIDISSNEKSKMQGSILTNSFVFTLLISLLFLILSIILYKFCDFAYLLKIKQGSKSDINKLVFISLVIFGVKLFSNNYNTILTALQKAYMVIVISVVSSLITVIILILGYSLRLNISILQYGLVVLLTDVFFSLILPILYLRRINFNYDFSFKLLNYKYFKENLLNNNFKFFTLSILVVFTFFSTNFFIGIILSYEDVTVYNLVNKYFNIITLFSIVALNPIWTKVAIHYGTQNYVEINKLLKKTNLYFYFFIIVGIGLLFFDKTFYSVFGHNKIIVGKYVSVVAMLSMLQLFYNNIYAYFLNGMNAVYVQIVGFVIAAIIIYPCYYFFCVYLKMGVLGAFWVQIIVYIPNTIMFPYYLKRKLKLS
jgi:O-antigen/teichoic acid export membrane protein